MYKNLKNEMTVRGVTQLQIAELLDCRKATVNDKINGKSEFLYGEAYKIKHVLFPYANIEYLFDSDDGSQHSA